MQIKKPSKKKIITRAIVTFFTIILIILSIFLPKLLIDESDGKDNIQTHAPTSKIENYYLNM